jgi:uncharacterized membrane protein
MRMTPLFRALLGLCLFASAQTGAFAQQAGTQPAPAADERTIEARVLVMNTVPCASGQEGCVYLKMRKTRGDGPEQEFSVTMEPQEYLGRTAPGFGVGDTLLVQLRMDGERPVYSVSDVVRRSPLLLLFIVFLLAVVLLGGRTAIRSFIGMAVSLAVLLGVMLPMILHGYPPLPVGIACSLAIMAITFVIAHGWNAKTIAALSGTAASLLLTGMLAALFTNLANVYGFDEETVFLISDFPGIDTRGILLAGIIIGALGVLDDITISQASAVMELRAANPLLRAHDLYLRAVRIGRDHIAGAVNTLVLAYAGSSLSLLLLLASQKEESWGTLINREMLATEIIRTLVGTIGLLACVPITTAIASWLATRTDVKKAAHGGHHHSHVHRH